MRHNFQLSQETRSILSQDVKGIADEMDVSDKYLYRILAGDETDPFAKLLPIVRGAVKKGIDITSYIARLSQINASGRVGTLTVLDCLSEKSTTENETLKCILKAVQDGEVDEREREAIQKYIERERQDLDLLEISLNYCGANGEEIRSKMRVAVDNKLRRRAA